MCTSTRGTRNRNKKERENANKLLQHKYIKVPIIHMPKKIKFIQYFPFPLISSV